MIEKLMCEKCNKPFPKDERSIAIIEGKRSYICEDCDRKKHFGVVDRLRNILRTCLEEDRAGELHEDENIESGVISILDEIERAVKLVFEK